MKLLKQPVSDTSSDEGVTKERKTKGAKHSGKNKVAVVLPASSSVSLNGVKPREKDQKLNSVKQ